MKSINTKWKVILHILKEGICIYCSVKKIRYYNANKVYIEKLLISNKDGHIKQFDMWKVGVEMHWGRCKCKWKVQYALKIKQLYWPCTYLNKGSSTCTVENKCIKRHENIYRSRPNWTIIQTGSIMLLLLCWLSMSRKKSMQGHWDIKLYR